MSKGALVISVRAGWRVVSAKAERRLARLAKHFNPGRKDNAMTIKLVDWVATRSGAAITISGKDAAGNRIKRSVKRIEGLRNAVSGASTTVATATDGVKYQLS